MPCIDSVRSVKRFGYQGLLYYYLSSFHSRGKYSKTGVRDRIIASHVG